MSDDMPEPPTWAQIFTALAALETEVRSDRQASERAAAANEGRMRTNRWTARVAILVALFGVLVGAQGYRAGNQAEDAATQATQAIEAANAERAARTVTACEQQADKAVKDNAQDAVMIDLLSDVVGGSENPETIDFLQPFIDRLNDNRSPVRDCSDAGIAAYYSSNGIEGFLP